MKIALVDDDQIFINHIYEKILKIDKDIEIEKYSDPNLFISNVCKSRIDLVLLDIDMPQLSGIEISRYLSSVSNDIYILFITNREDLVFEAFNKNVIGFIPKSKIEFEWNQIECKIIHMFDNDCVILKSSEGIISFSKRDILYFERVLRKLFLYTINGERYQVFYPTIRDFIQSLRYNDIFLINKSEGINLKYIVSYKNPIIKLKGCKNNFKLSKNRKDEFLLIYFASRKDFLWK
jgi:two-component system, LytTR family, response regulator LytT